MTSPPGDGPVQAAESASDGKITRDVVLAAALEIIDRDGAEALSMRRLARALNRDPMILYRHAPNKAALLDDVAEIVLAQLEVDSADPDWAGQLRGIARDYRRLALAHPHVVPLLVTACAAWPRSWPPTTAPPSSNAASTSCWPAWRPRCLPRRVQPVTPARSDQAPRIRPAKAASPPGCRSRTGRRPQGQSHWLRPRGQAGWPWRQVRRPARQSAGTRTGAGGPAGCCRPVPVTRFPSFRLA